MLKVICVFIALSFYYIELSAQSLHFGKTVKEDGTPIPYANIIFLKKADSTFVSGKIADKFGGFTFQTDSSIIIKANSIGYCDTFAECHNQDTLKIIMNEKSILLGEVTVKSALPITRIEGNALVTNVKGTILEKIGSAKDVLARLPGIMVEQGGISVFGKGVPTIYINGRIMRTENMLDQLQSSKIKKVELITNPGARYNASVSSVIRIYTERAPGEGFSFDSKTSLGIRNYLSLSEMVETNYRYNDLDVFTMFEYDHSKMRGISSNIQNTWLTQHYIQNVGMRSVNKTHLFEGKAGFNYNLSSKHTFGVYYQASYKPIKVKSEYDSWSWIDNILCKTSNSDKYEDTNTNEHLIDAYYNGIFGKWSIQATFDLLNKETNNNDLSKELFGNTNNRSVTIIDKSKSRLIAGELHLSRPLFNGSISLGTEMSRSQRKEIVDNTESVIEDSNDEVREGNISVYVETAQRIGRINTQLGLRYEHINSRYYCRGEKMDEQSRIYDNVFPTASVTIPIKKSVIQLSYSKKYERPRYSQLSGAISYVNSYLYQSGNPLLRSQYSDNISLLFRYKWFILMTNYTHIDHKIIDECIQYDNDATITLLRKWNSPSALHKLQMMVSIAPHFGLYYPNLMVGVVSQNYMTQYISAYKKFNQPLCIVRWNNILRFKQGHLINIDLNWRSSGDSENVRLGEVWSMNIGLNKQYGKHWNMKLLINDIFNTSKKNVFLIYSGYCDVQMAKQSTSRNIEWTIRYNFNTTKSNYKGKGAKISERGRL